MKEMVETDQHGCKNTGHRLELCQPTLSFSRPAGKSLEDELAAPFVLGLNGASEEIPTREALLESILLPRIFQSNATKSLGEMNPATALGNDHGSGETHLVESSDR